MRWSPQQSEALRRVRAWLRDRTKPFFYLGGYAGTGKTTLAKHFAEAVPGLVLFAAYTGKAASVMRSKGCRDATTIHQLIYRPVGTPLDDEGPRFEVKEGTLIERASLVVIDECSMVSDRIGRDLLRFGKPLLVLGDPAQLPPVKGAGFFTKGEPDYMLTEVHRQAEHSPILRLATAVREGRRFGFGEDGPLRVVHNVSDSEVLGAEQVIVGTHASRRALDAGIRAAHGRTGDLPLAGDRLMCLKNNHDLGIFNGQMFTALRDAERLASCVYHVRLEGDDGRRLGVDGLIEPLLTCQADHRKLDGEQFGFGHAMTCHKSQGSQFASAVVLDESRAFREDAKRWLYTAVTRASERLTLVRRAA